MVRKVTFHCIIGIVICLCNGNLYAQKGVLSSRWFHPIDKADTLETISVIRLLKPDRIDWTYCDDPSILKKYSSRGLRYSLAMNPQIPDSAGFTTTAKYRIKTMNGTPYAASWMKGWKIPNPYWGCVNNPYFKQLFLKRAKQLIDLNAYALFVDDPLFNVQLQRETHDMGGCVCNYCLKGFQDYAAVSNGMGKLSGHDLLANIKDAVSNKKNTRLLAEYKEYQKASVVAFLKNWKTEIVNYKKNIKILTNNFRGKWDDIYLNFDGGIAEIQEQDLNYTTLDTLFRTSDKFNKSQLLTLVSSDEYAHNYLIAYLISKKRDYLLPWDLFVPGAGNANRYYADTDRLKSFIKFLKKKNTVIKYGAAPSVFSKNKWYGVEYDENENINYITLYTNAGTRRLNAILYTVAGLLLCMLTFIIARIFLKRFKNKTVRSTNFTPFHNAIQSS